MSALLNASPKVGGAVSFLDGTLAPDHVSSGIPYEIGGLLAVEVDGAISHYHQGLGYTATGRLAATLTGPPTRIGNGAAPFNTTGHLVLAIGSSAHYANGIPYTPNSSVNSTATPP
jgi:hypothetical protein